MAYTTLKDGYKKFWSKYFIVFLTQGFTSIFISTLVVYLLFVYLQNSSLNVEVIFILLRVPAFVFSFLTINDCIARVVTGINTTGDWWRRDYKNLGSFLKDGSLQIFFVGWGRLTWVRVEKNFDGFGKEIIRNLTIALYFYIFLILMELIYHLL
ncbi:hypothetical protein A2886_02485 [candidate division WWE3 bacterium RIFCSPHIGHO2_01_FULL_42_13]|uniref:Uncharacterized protein n=1 Tax=candidate division WWE3 bacterium RIFCSPHIGHO2_01_FULL_42_13 TaxID=1802617 RepID=A0A1F4URM8_UNCKA|nr:MAG: hypothetical protein A2886_02485 [candidate division WWE3 bacterium RIFCSPHIGHO2_01_FULL_42_13]